MTGSRRRLSWRPFMRSSIQGFIVSIVLLASVEKVRRVDEQTPLIGIGFTYWQDIQAKPTGKSGSGSIVAWALRQGPARSLRSRYALTDDQSRPGYTSGCQEKQFPKGVHISPSNDEENMRAQLVCRRRRAARGIAGCIAAPRSAGTSSIACSPAPRLANVDDFTSFDGQVRSLGEC